MFVGPAIWLRFPRAASVRRFVPAGERLAGAVAAALGLAVAALGGAASPLSYLIVGALFWALGVTLWGWFGHGV